MKAVTLSLPPLTISTAARRYKPKPHALAGVEPLAIGRRQQVERAADARPDAGLDVGHAAFTGTDGDVETQPIAVEPPPARLQRLHLASLDEDRTMQVTAVGEVPES